jgi:hypothetical protein
LYIEGAMSRLILLLICMAVQLPVTAQVKAVITRLTADSIYVESDAVDTSARRYPKVRPVAGYHASAKGSIRMSLGQITNTGQEASGSLLFQNISNDTVTLKNVVPFGEDPNFVYITGKGDHPLSRTHLFRPGFVPVNVIVPDNAWDLGFCTYKLSVQKSLTGLVRRDRSSIKQGIRNRFETI